MEEADASILTQMLRGAVQSGTGSALTLKQTVDVAGKTGTTGKNCDKWFVGYTPELLCGVWYGHEYPKPLDDVSGNPSLRIFDAVMKEVIQERGISQKNFKTPDDVVIVRYCKDSGCLPCRTCFLDPRGSRVEYGYFKKGTEPSAICTCHVSVKYCEHGGIATAHCPEQSCREIALIRVSRSFPRQVKIEDAPYTYVESALSKERYLSKNEPYYTEDSESKRFYGIGMNVIPFNRICPAHTQESFWRRRADVE
jgi:penicillin-binding protein 1A